VPAPISAVFSFSGRNDPLRCSFHLDPQRDQHSPM
jgi:hypothetical protein